MPATPPLPAELDSRYFRVWVRAMDAAGNAVATPLMPYAYIVANAVDALFTVANGGSPLTSETNAGEVHIYLRVNANLADMDTINQPSAA